MSAHAVVNRYIFFASVSHIMLSEIAGIYAKFNVLF